MLKLRQTISTLAIMIVLLMEGMPIVSPAITSAAPFDQPTVIAADGTSATITGIDPLTRTAGMLALYTPAFGPSTRTNQFGAEAVLVKTGQPNQYRVESICTVWDWQAGRCTSAGDNTIPVNGVVLSAAPGGNPDVRVFIRDHIKAGDLVTIYIPVRRDATRALDAIDPTPATNPNGVDPNSGQCYPGCRGANQLIMYTPAFGERTGTNDFGYEVTVVDGRVVSRGGNNSPIPQDGFVLSGHGAAGTWLSANTIGGAAVSVEEMTVTITIGPDAYIFTAQAAITAAEQTLADARGACLDVPYESSQAAIDDAKSLMSQAQAALEANDDQGAIDLATAAQTQAGIARYRLVESRVVDSRGIWVRPTETTPAAIAATLDRLAAAGINIVFLETFYHGYTIFPSETAARNGVETQRPQFAGFDPLQVWVDEAHARGMELHAWVENFYVGNDALGGPGPILSVHPEWAAVEREDVGKSGPQPSNQERGYYFLDPAIPEARQYLLDIYTEMLSRYAIDGVHLDYIRYPISLPLQNSFSYSDYSRTAFEARYGIDPYTITPEGNPSQWAQWVAWRQNNINTFVEAVRESIATTRPAAALSAAVFPDEFESKIRKLQDWEFWAQQGWLDFLTGMSFGRSPESVAADTTAMLEAVDGKALIYTGIYSPFNGQPPEAMVAQIEAIRAVGGHGVALFDWTHLTEAHQAALREGPFRMTADAPHSRPAKVVATGLTDLRRRIDAVYLPQGCIDARTATPLRNRLNEIAGALERADRGQGNSRAAIEHTRRRLAGLTDLMSRHPINDALLQRLRDEIALYDSILGYTLTEK